MSKLYNKLSLVRTLYTFPKTRDEIIIANNSGIFFTLAALRMHGMHMHPNLVLIKPSFWMDNIHSDYKNLDWGQTPRGLPWFVREEFYKIYKYHSPDEYIRWGQFKELREHVLEELRRLNIRIYTGTPMIEKQAVGYKVITNESTFHANEETFFYNSFKEPNTSHEIADLPRISHTALYSIPRNEILRTVVLLGGGRSAIWAAQHFPNTLFASISASDKLPLFTDEKYPENLDLFKLKNFQGENPKLRIRRDAYDPRIANIIDNNGKGVFEGDFYCAIGLIQREDVTKAVKQENLSLYPFDNWRNEWVAVEELPIGSLMEATMRWAVETNNLSLAYETFCFHPDFGIDQIIMEMQEQGINFPNNFFDYLRNEILSRRKILSEEEVIDIYKSCYKQAYEDNVSNADLNEFEKKLRKIEQDRIELYRSKAEAALENVTRGLER